MCTLIAFHHGAGRGEGAGGGGRSGTWVAANRDELYVRPARPPELIAPRVVAGVDVAQGGTWLGVHASGTFVGLTNQRSFGPRDPSKRTRGEVVTGALASGTLDGALAHLRTLDGRDYNGFNLLVGDGARLFVAYARPDVPGLEIEALAEGIHVLGNDRLGSPDFPKAARIARDASAHAAIHDATALEEQLGPLRTLLADHTQPPLADVRVPADSPFPRELVQALEATCIHTPQYGTVSSALLELVPGTRPRYWFADGPPCRTDFRPVPMAELLID